MDIPVYENDRAFIKRTLLYPSDFSDATKAGKPVPKTDTTTLYFNVRDSQDDDTAVIALTDVSSSQIQWLDATNGIILIKLGTNTNGHAGTKYYDLRAKMTDGSFITFEDGRLLIKNLASVS